MNGPKLRVEVGLPIQRIATVQDQARLYRLGEEFENRCWNQVMIKFPAKEG